MSKTIPWVPLCYITARSRPRTTANHDLLLHSVPSSCQISTIGLVFFAKSISTLLFDLQPRIGSFFSFCMVNVC